MDKDLERPRDEHLEWCKQRAREYLARGEYDDAVTSMLSDLSKHPAWQNNQIINMMAMLWMLDRSPEKATKLIEGFR